MFNFLPLMGSQGGTNANNMGMAMAIAVYMVLLTTFQQFLSNRFRPYIEGFIRRFISSMDPYVQIKFHEDSSDGSLKNLEAFKAIETYLSCCLCLSSVSRLKAKSVKDIREPVLCPDEGERVTDHFQGIEVWWEFKERVEDYDRFRGSGRKIKCYTLTFRKTWRDKVTNEYVKYVMEEGTAVATKQRQLKLYANSGMDNGEFGKWKCMKNFDHPATFATLGMEESKKQDIIDDLKWFSNGREYFRSIGKPWKRGYLLYGPPGTGKSTMIAAIANLLGYDVYDLELTTIRNNASFKGLLNRVPANSIIVIEDIDRSSMDVVSQSDLRKKRKEEATGVEEGATRMEKVTLSGLLNCLDGLVSANDGGILMIMTTNHVEKLDPALIRKGRMDVHIEMSYCGFEAFRVLAKNYLGIIEEEHELFPRIKELLNLVKIIPGDVSERLMIKKFNGAEAVVERLQRLIIAMEERLEEEKEEEEEEVED